jgi:hypothetical protein
MSSNSNVAVNPAFLCPITHEIMTDPVIGPDGHSYNRSAIEEWFKYSMTSPLTRQPMMNRQLTPNFNLKNLIDQFISTNAPAPAPAPVAVASEPITIELEVTASKYKGDTYVHAKAKPPTSGTRLPAGISVAVDVSGSMGEEASVKTDQIEIVGFSRLDLVKHSLNTIVNTLGDEDVFAISAFTTSAFEVLPPMKMNAFGKKLALDRIAGLNPMANTNLWSGLHMAYEATKHDLFSGVNKNVVILTDGQSNQDPPRGILPTLDLYLQSAEKVNVHTFGYGYDLDAKLLNSIADRTHGTYNYIPDCTMVGTIFINYLSYMLSTISTNNLLKIEASGDSKITRVVGYTGNEINIGNLQFGQSRDVVFKITHDTDPNIKVTLVQNGVETSKTVTSVSTDVDHDMLVEYARLQLVDTLKHCQTLSLNDAMVALHYLHTDLKALPVADRIVDVLTDIQSADENEGQISKAFSKPEWYAKWGRYFIPSILRANSLQYCNNFKDKSVQKFGGAMFRTFQDSSNEIFCKLTPPEPSLMNRYQRGASAYTGYGSPSATPARAAPTTTLASLSLNSIGCFDGFGNIETPDGKRLVKHIQEGDYLSTPEGPARVICVIKSLVPNGCTDLVELNGMYITPWHPIRVNGKWYYPCEYSGGILDMTTCEYVYDFVLDKGHIVNINGNEVVTLAHNFTGPVIEHEFFGTQRVLDDLSKMPGWSNGHITIMKSHFTHDSNGLINGWIFDE